MRLASILPSVRVLAWCTAALPLAAHAEDVGKIYQNNCASCHGDDLGGGSAPSMLDDAWTLGGTDEEIARTIRLGSLDNGMPAWEGALSDAEIRALVVLIRERRNAAAQADATRTASGGPARTVAGHTYRVEDVVSGVETPWSMAFLPDGRMLITEKPGRLRLLENGRLSAPVSGTPAVLDASQGGLMEVALHPAFKDNGWIYLAYSGRAPKGGERDGMTTLVRGRLRDGRWVDEEKIYVAPEGTFRTAGHHWGCRIAFDGQGYLFFTIGDRGAQDQAQQLDRPNGKVHRIHDDGRVPADNPFAGTAGALPTIWSFGHRNPQGLDFNPADGSLWSTEHGPRGGDELNLVQRGKNYGWPVITYGINYNGTPITEHTSAPGMEQPVLHWTPSIAVCGIDFYEGAAFPQWEGALLVTALAGQDLRLLRFEGGKVVAQDSLLRGVGRVRDVGCGPDGAIYAALNGPDKIVRLVPVP